MRNEKANKTRLGLFVTIALVLFTIGVYKIGDKESMFGSTITISSVFKNVNGLQAGSNVRFSGINIGRVDQILIINDSTLKVEMLLEEEVMGFLKKDAIASIGTDGLVGNMIVNISPGKGHGAFVEDGDFVSSFARVETEAMLSKLGNTTENIALLTINLLEVAEKMNTGKGSVSKLINDDIMAHDLEVAIRNLKEATQHINTTSRQLGYSIEAVNQGQGLLGYLLKDTSFESKINLTLYDLDTIISNRVVPIMNLLEQSSENIAITTAELNNIVQQIDLNEGLVGTLLQDSTLSESFKETLWNLNKGSELLNADLEALQHNFLFRKYFRKLEKEKAKESRKAVVKK